MSKRTDGEPKRQRLFQFHFGARAQIDGHVANGRNPVFDAGTTLLLLLHNGSQWIRHHERRIVPVVNKVCGGIQGQLGSHQRRIEAHERGNDEG